MALAALFAGVRIDRLLNQQKDRHEYHLQHSRIDPPISSSQCFHDFDFRLLVCGMGCTSTVRKYCLLVVQHDTVQMMVLISFTACAQFTIFDNRKCFCLAARWWLGTYRHLPGDSMSVVTVSRLLAWILLSENMFALE